MIRRDAALVEALRRQLHAPARRTGRAAAISRGSRRRVAVHERQRLRLRIRQQPVAVHRDAVGGAQEQDSFACAADLDVVAVLTISNTLAGTGIGPLGLLADRVDQRASISLQPPQPGSSPTPHSTRPI